MINDQTRDFRNQGFYDFDYRMHSVGLWWYLESIPGPTVRGQTPISFYFETTFMFECKTHI